MVGNILKFSLRENFEQLLRTKRDDRILSLPSESGVKSLVIGPSHFVVLTTSGKIYRSGFKIREVSKNDELPEKISPSSPSVLFNTESEANPAGDERTSREIVDLIGSLARASPNQRAAMISEFNRAPGFLNLSRYGQIPQREVPEQLIQAVQDVLQNRSRQEIERELLYNRLNVNSAVNALLNLEDTPPPSNPTIAEQPDHHMTNFRISFGPRSFRPHYMDRRINRSSRTSLVEESAPHKEPTNTCDFDFSVIEYWASDKIFILIAAMFSELLAVDSEGFLHSWRWNEPSPVLLKSNTQKGHTFEKALKLKLQSERVTHLASSLCRATLGLKSNRVCSIMDSSLWGVSSLEGVFSVNSGKKDVELASVHSNNIFSACVLKNGSVWWWGMLPYSQRTKQYMFKSPKQSSTTQCKRSKIVEGSLVTHRSHTMLHNGCLAYYFDGSQLKMGRLEDSHLSREKAPFVEVFRNSDQTEVEDQNAKKTKTNKVTGSKKRKRETVIENERLFQEWNLANVVFLDERVNHIGVAVKVEKDNVLVDFDHFKNPPTSSSDTRETCSLKNSRIFNVKDLKVIKRRPKRSAFLPHCQAVPKRLDIAPASEFISVFINEENIFILTLDDDKEFTIEGLCPGAKVSKLYKLTGTAAEFLRRFSCNSITFSIYHDCLMVSTPKGYLFFARDNLDSFSSTNQPCFPSITNLAFTEITSSSNKFCLTMNVFEKIPHLSENSPHFDLNLHASFGYNRNSLHFLAYLLRISTSSYGNLHADAIKTYLDDFSQQPEFRTLMTHQDLDGLTPFLYSIKIKSFRFALWLFEHCSRIGDSNFFFSAIAPPISFSFNPIYLLCSGESCTYTWTGNTHICQDTYECRTCGLVNKMCCCVECAISCHRGHDIIIKYNSTTAFCDCWEKCSCQAVYIGDQFARRELFKELIKYRELFSNIGTGSDHLLLFLVLGIERQYRQYRKYVNNRPKTNRETTDEKTNALRKSRERILGVPIDSVKKPSSFYKEALKDLLYTKEAVQSLFMYSSPIEPLEKISSMFEGSKSLLLAVQSSAKIYDCFVFNLFTSCSKSYAKLLYANLVSNFADTDSNAVLTNFIRSCVRIYITFVSVSSPVLLSKISYSFRMKNEVQQTLQRVLYFFEKFPVTAVNELSFLSTAVLAPLFQGSIPQSPLSFSYFNKLEDVIEFCSRIFCSVSARNQDKNFRRHANNSTNRRDLNFLDNVIVGTTRLGNSNVIDLYQHGEDDILILDNDEDSETALDETPTTDEEIYTEEEEEQIFEMMDEDHDDDHFDQQRSPSIEEFPPLVDEHTDNDDTTGESDIGAHREHQFHPNRFGPILNNLLDMPLRRLRAELRDSLDSNFHWTVRGHSFGDSRFESFTNLRHGGVESIVNSDQSSIHNISTQNALARTFMIALKLVSDLCLKYKLFHNPIIVSTFKETIVYVFKWLFFVLDTFESKILYGVGMLNASNFNSQNNLLDCTPYTERDAILNQVGLNRTRRQAEQHPQLNDRNRIEFASSLLSNERSAANEHHGILPYVDLLSYRHIAYVLDGYLYYLVSNKAFTHSDSQAPIHNFSLVKPSDTNYFSRSYFSRTISTLRNSYFSNSNLLMPVDEGIPLATNPCILRPSSKISDLFAEDSVDYSNSDTITRIPYSFSIPFANAQSVSADQLLMGPASSFYNRWNNVINIFSQVFSDTVVSEGSSMFQDLCRYLVKERAFRSLVEKSRSYAANDISFNNMERKRSKLICQTFKTLNSAFSKSVAVTNLTAAFVRIKVSFKNEPAEGVGVVRNFFSVIALALVSDQKLPDLSNTVDNIELFTTSRNISEVDSANQPTTSRSPTGGQHIVPRTNYPWPRGRPGERPFSQSTFGSHNSLHRSDLPSPMNLFLVDNITLSDIENMQQQPDLLKSKDLSIFLSIYFKKKVTPYCQQITEEVTEALLQTSPDLIFECLKNDQSLKSKVGIISTLYYEMNQNCPHNQASFSPEVSIYPENAPLFFQPGKSGFYFPVNAKKTPLRLNAYRNVGRIIGLALLFTDLVPIVLSRPVCKFLLNRPISFHDFAFYDHVHYESLRLLLLEAQKIQSESSEVVPMHGLHFCVSVTNVEGTPRNVELCPNGSTTAVTSSNTEMYIQLYTQYLMIDCVKKELTAMLEGLHDVIHPHLLNILNPEDFRLLLNGNIAITVADLKKIVRFSSECADNSSEAIAQQKKWFWEVLESFTQPQRDSLLQFWTSSPVMNLNENNTRPNVTFKPQSNHLPTANTCIMRLYVPLYKTKAILRSKLLLAIETKTFGFV